MLLIVVVVVVFCELQPVNLVCNIIGFMYSFVDGVNEWDCFSFPLVKSLVLLFIFWLLSGYSVMIWHDRVVSEGFLLFTVQEIRVGCMFFIRWRSYLSVSIDFMTCLDVLVCVWGGVVYLYSDYMGDAASVYGHRLLWH